MKRIVLFGMIVYMVLGNVGCSSTKKINENLNRIEMEQREDTAEQKTEQETSQENQEDHDTQENSGNVPKEIVPMNASDLAVTDGENMVLLDSLYDGFETTEEEIETETSENHFVGEIYVDEYVYKTYFHQFKDFEIYTSNTEYPLKGEDMHTYHIRQISLLTDKYRTARGAYIGIDIKEVLELYGEGESFSASDYYEEKNCKGLGYRYDNYSLKFVYNDRGVVVHIDLYVRLIGADSFPKDNEEEQSEESETEQICRKIEFNQAIEIDLNNDLHMH
ncbi:hypothetical protein [Anaerosporobacter sp.]|uniref:hypothetical protein n=1 Tax=Anaerosporobacter sp. TaxID=1872529 RepID=UPI00286F23F5|nr:hypothetical protein [Anaerosporobacter sp.]